MGRRQHLLDAAVPIVVGGVFLVGVGLHADANTRPLALALGLAAAVVLAARQRAPVVTLAVSGGLVLAVFAIDSAAGPAAVFAPAVALYALVLTRGRIYQLVAGLAAVGAVIAAQFLAGHHSITFQTFAHVALVAVPLLAAEWLRTRRSYVSLLREQLELAERTRKEEARRQVEHERLRIARDLHDVVAHTLTTINVQSGVAGHLLNRDPGHARRALATIEDASRDALDELRAIVGVLREREAERAPLQPAPTLEDIAELIDRAHADGLDVSLDIYGDRPERLPEALQLAAFRIVQESLTNVQRHAPSARAHVSLSYEADRVLIEVENAGGATRNGDNARYNGGVGVGIIGMQERAAAIDGKLTAARSQNGFRVTAELPYRRAE